MDWIALIWFPCLRYSQYFLFTSILDQWCLYSSAIQTDLPPPCLCFRLDMKFLFCTSYVTWSKHSVPNHCRQSKDRSEAWGSGLNVPRLESWPDFLFPKSSRLLITGCHSLLQPCCCYQFTSLFISCFSAWRRSLGAVPFLALNTSQGFIVSQNESVKPASLLWHH